MGSITRGSIPREDPFARSIADFSCREARLVVETDGISYEDPEADAIRDAWFRSQGWTVLRFTDEEVLENTDAVLETIWKAVREHVPGARPRGLADGGRLELGE